MVNDGPIGVFDSGIGGLTVVRELRKVLPGEDLIYFGDTGRTPYGSRPPTEILAFMQEILSFFAAQQVKIAVVACNTMTSLGIELARGQYPFLLLGVNTGAQAAVQASVSKKIGIIATEATIASGKHSKAIKLVEPHAITYPQACPEFVPLVEQEQWEGDVIEASAQKYLLPLQKAGIDALILGCTHYPCIAGIIEQIMGAEVALIDPAYETATDCKQMLSETKLLAAGNKGSIRLCFSADLERAERLAGRILQEAELSVEIIDLQDFS